MSSLLKKLLPLLLLFAGPFYTAFAETPEKRASMRHEFRIGWGDQMFESLVWQNPSYIVKNMPQSYLRDYNERYRYTQHWFGEYQWRVNKWFGFGAAVDISGCLWDQVTRNGLGEETERLKNRSFWNLTIMPTLRFTWLNRKYVSLYTSLGAGLGINGGTETDAFGRHTLCGFSLDVALIGMTVDWKRWFAFAELGGLYSLQHKSAVFMLNSRIVSVGAGIRF